MRRPWLRPQASPPGRETPDEVERTIVLQWSASVLPAERESLATKLLLDRRRAVYLWCRRQVADPDLAQDLSQEVMMRALMAMRSPRTEIHAFGPWLFTLTRNVCLNHRRARSRRPQEDPGVEMPTLASPQPGPEQQLLDHERRDLVRKWMQDDLPSLESTVLWMRVVDEVPLERIASLMDLEGRDAVRVILQRARRHLLRSAESHLAGDRGPREMEA